MQTETICSWREFDDAVAEAGRRAGGPPARPSLVFRGLARAEYSNRSTLARLGAGFAGLERHLIRNFRKYAHRERPGPTLWDWLSLAQHHGLPTRLTDWTFSPMVAAHFATATRADEDGVVYAVDCAAAHERLPGDLRGALDDEGATVFTTELLAAHAPSLEEFDALGAGDPFLLFFEPPSLDDRIVNQSAVLSVMCDARAHVDDWLEANPDLWQAWRLTAAAKMEIRARLDQAGITERVLMPGLDGLATWLRRYYAPAAPADPAGGSMAGPAVTGTDQGEQD